MNPSKKPKTILVAPLHWGLGHAARCIPIIRSLLEQGYNVVLASDGGALSLLKHEFPYLDSLELPSYAIEYPKKDSNFKLKLLMNLPHIGKTISRERKLIKKLVKDGRIDGIISDNRLGVYSKKIPSVYLTHQLNVLSGNTSWFSSKAHQKVIKKFNECWVPDIEGAGNLSGKLGHLKKPTFSIKYIGPLSRMIRRELPVKYDFMCLLSGPEPQRSILERKFIETFSVLDKKVLIVQGVVDVQKTKEIQGNITLINFLTTKDLEKVINESEIILSRSGYTTIMDIAAMRKKAYFIPTPGQYEQEYLANRLKLQRVVPSCKQEDFSIEKLNEISEFKGFKDVDSNYKPEYLFRLFQSK
ncbi:MAG: glycosyltransferase [Bacteroidia bacterium]|nr:glycosyltransferase [Bacteroidia bacterium]NNF32099.1 glycosyltransferase [Flavobacteriaceae bacterium]MBT8275138.1 glycosyltransferase [Bacteroidia bacterium]NNJ82251.1 glycosyltransferase [Flavobacteriaceae bacterium]NNK54963.1 glycosyltransferase [Flavobacteriaceae bacterium]